MKKTINDWLPVMTEVCNEVDTGGATPSPADDATSTIEQIEARLTQNLADKVDNAINNAFKQYKPTPAPTPTKEPINEPNNDPDPIQDGNNINE